MAKTTATVRDKRVWATLHKAPDLDLRIKVTQADSLELINIRDWIPSLKQDGRGATFPTHLLPDVIEALESLRAHLGVGHGRIDPGEHQGRLDG